MLPIDRRYQNAQELQSRFQSIDGRIRMIVITVCALLVVAMMVLIGLQIWKAKEQEQRLTQLNATYQQEQELQQQEQKAQQQQMTQLTDSIAELRTYNQQMKEKETTAEAKRKHVKDAIDEGNAIVDKTMRQTKIDEHLDTLSNLLYLWPDYSEKSMSGYRAIETYLEQIKMQYNDTEMAEIRKTMNLHCAAKIDKWNMKFGEIGE